MKKRNLSLLFLVLVLLVVPVMVVSAAEQEPTPSMDDINEVAKDLFCPVCENNPLDQCGSQACIDMREEIGILLMEGKTEAEIQAYFIDYHGDRVVSAPPFRGLNILLWIAVPLVVVGAVLFIVLVMPRWVGKGEAAPAVVEPDPEIADEYISQLEEQLKDRKND